ncbi:MAG: hypothetical protein ACXV5L_08020 [Thermoanaerobaculia bacterium]
MSRGRLATDSLAFANETIEGRGIAAVAAEHLKETPAFWGRYFRHPGFARDYSPMRENVVLFREGIRLLPIARQTMRVGGTIEDGLADGDRNVDAFVNAMGPDYLAAQGRQWLMFLDVEGTSSRNPTLSLPYFIGWSNALAQRSADRSGGRFEIRPAIYCRQSNEDTWCVLAHSADLGHAVDGAWIFRSHSDACESEVPDWDPGFFLPSTPLPCPVMAWQFAIDCYRRKLDFSMVNPQPEVEKALLSRLVIPRGND